MATHNKLRTLATTGVLALVTAACGSSNSTQEQPTGTNINNIFADDECDIDIAYNDQTPIETPYAAGTGFVIGEDADDTSRPCVTLDETTLLADGVEYSRCTSELGASFTASSFIIVNERRFDDITLITTSPDRGIFDVSVMTPSSGMEAQAIDSAQRLSDDFCRTGEPISFSDDLSSFQNVRFDNAAYSCQQDGRSSYVLQDDFTNRVQQTFLIDGEVLSSNTEFLNGTNNTKDGAMRELLNRSNDFCHQTLQ